MNWRELDQHFDAALLLEAEARADYLATLQLQNPQTAARIVELLAALEQSSPLDAKIEIRLEPSFAGIRAAGEYLGNYQLQRLLGQGGMGEVWLAQASGKPPVALKLIRSEFSARVLGQRLARERDAMARVSHPNIAKLLDSGISTDGTPYLVIEYVEGDALLVAASRQRLGLRARIETLLKVAHAVAAAQAQLIVHRDIKPANILVMPNGEPKLLDFGIAKALDASGFAESSTLTHVHGGAMTPAYAAPEQHAGRAVSTASDVYSLGVVLHELLLGTRPNASAPSRLAALGAVAPGLALSPRKLSSALRGDLDVLLTTALAHEPSQRYPNAAAFAQDLHAYLSGTPLHAQPESLRYRVRKLVQRHWAVSSALALAFLAVIGASAWAWQERAVAKREAARALYVQRFIESVMSSTLPGEVRDDPPSTAELLARGGELALQDRSADPDARLALLQSLAMIQREHRAYAQADQLLAGAQQLVAQSHAPAWQMQALAADRAAVAYHLQTSSETRKRFEQAYQRAVAAGADRAWQVDGLRVLITAAVDDDDGEAARAHAERLLALTDQNDIGALTQAVVAYTFDQQFRTRALELAQLALQESRLRFGEAHAQTAYAAMRLGNVLRIKGDIDAAADQLELAVRVARVAYPHQHPQLARILEELARVRARQQRIHESTHLWREVLAIRVAHDGVDSFAAARSTSFLAAALLREGDYAQAATFALQSHARLSTLVGASNAQTMDAASYASAALLELGRHSEAIAILPALDAPMPSGIEPNAHWRFRELQLAHIQHLPPAQRVAALPGLIRSQLSSVGRDNTLALLNAIATAIDNHLVVLAREALIQAKPRVLSDDSTQQSEIVALLELLVSSNLDRVAIQAARAVVAKRRGERHFAVRSADKLLQSLPQQ